jgi:acetylglutamate kinase
MTTQQSPLVIKLGGTLLESDKALAALFTTLKAFFNEVGRPLVLVHGGGVLVDNQLKAMGLTSTKKDGLRVTPFDQIPVIAGALAGTANKLLLAQAIAHDIKSVGLCLADGGLCWIPNWVLWVRLKAVTPPWSAPCWPVASCRWSAPSALPSTAS